MVKRVLPLCNMFALTLIKTDGNPITPAHIALVQGALSDMSIRADDRPPHWFTGHNAVRGWVLDKPNDTQMTQLRALFDPHKIDVICEAENQPKLKLALFDLESTCIEQESLDELGTLVGQHDHIAAITKRAMDGEITMHEAFVERIALLAGVEQLHIQKVITSLSAFDEMHETIKWLQKNGVICVLVSSGVDIFVKPMAERYGFDEFYCSHIDMNDDGSINGNLTGHIMTGPDKGKTATMMIEKLGIDKAEAMAMGDGANDIFMMGAVGRPFGWRPKPALSAVTPNQFNHSDWSAIRYALS